MPVGNLVYALGLMLLCHATWGSNDDFFINAIASGAIGPADIHVAFSNVLMGVILKAMASVLPGINWFWVIQLCATYAAYNAVGYVLLRRLGVRLGLLFYLPFMTATGYSLYVTWTFTRVAALVAAAGWLCWLWALEAPKQRRIALFGGDALIVLGLLIRPESWAMATGLAVALMLGQWLTSLIRHKPSKLASRAAVVVPALLIAGCFAAEYAAYQVPSWKAYRAYDAARTGVFDYGCSSYAENPDAFEALGISEEDYNLAIGWTYADTEKLNTETLDALTKLPYESRNTFSGWTLQNAAERFVQNKLLLLGALFSILLLCMVRRFRWLPVLGLYAGTMVVLAALVYAARFPPRVLDALAVAFSIFLLGVHTADEFVPTEKNHPPVLVILAVTVAVPLLLNGDRWLSPETYRYEGQTLAEKKEDLAELEEENDTSFLYLEDAGVQIPFWNMYPLWAAPLPGSAANFYSLGGWLVNMPVTNAVLDAYGVQNPMAALGENDKVLLMDASADSVQEKIDYVRRNYHPDVTWSVCGTLHGSPVIAVTDRPTSLGTENGEVRLQCTAEPAEEYVILTGTLAGVAGAEPSTSEQVWCLLVEDAANTTKAFRFLPQQGEAGTTFTVKIPLSELEGKEFTVSAALRPAGTPEFTFHTAAIPLELNETA